MVKVKIFLLPIMLSIVFSICFLIAGDIKSAMSMLGAIGEYLSSMINIPWYVNIIIICFVCLLTLCVILYNKTRCQGDRIYPQKIDDSKNDK